VHAVIAGLLDPCVKIRELWGCTVEQNGDGSPYAHNVTPIFYHNTTAGWIKAAMKITIPMLHRVVYCGQQADDTAGSQTHMHGGHSYLPLHDIPPPPSDDMIDDIGVESENDCEMRRANP
jgi:hypothetical protein